MKMIVKAEKRDLKKLVNLACEVKISCKEFSCNTIKVS